MTLGHTYYAYENTSTDKLLQNLPDLLHFPLWEDISEA